MPINTLLTRHATYRPDHLAVVFEDQRLTFAQFNRRVNRLANALLDLGLQKGDKVAMILPNCLEMLDLYWAVSKIGLVIVPLSPLLRGDGLTTLINDSDSVALFTTHSMAAEINAIRVNFITMPPDRYFLTDSADTPNFGFYGDLVGNSSETEPPYVSITATDPYNIIYSSGTTGLPKGIIHTHQIREAYCTGFSAAFRIHPESVILHSGSLVFNGAFLTFMPWMYLGATYVLHPAFDVERLIETTALENVTHIMMVPSQIIALLRSPNFDAEKLQSLEMIMTVGAPLHLEHKEELNRRLPNRFYELYGLTEGFVTVLDRDDYARKASSVGIPPPLYEMRIVDDEGNDLPAGQVGEIIGRGPITMPGYYKRPDLTNNAIRDGWLYSGDLGYVDADGFLYLVDRKKDHIISGGVNVYPRDIEEVIVGHPAVQEAAVFGVPHDKWGETPVAAVMLRDGETISPDELKTWVNERVSARYQKISDIIIMDMFPRSVAGKTLRRVMQQHYTEDE
jgi:acyl-CoA synthetase (AMP-forming)/AMP-acid ligase II